MIENRDVFSPEFERQLAALAGGSIELPLPPAPRVLAAGVQPPVRKQRTEFLAEHVPQGATVLDLGCGWGEVIYHLKQLRGIREFGLELRPDHVKICQDIGLEVYQADLNDLQTPVLRHVFTRRWDVGLALDTLGYWRLPAVLFAALSRCVRTFLITVGNSGHVRFRWEALCSGINSWPNALVTPDGLRYQAELGSNRWSLDGFERWIAPLGWNSRLIARRCGDASYRRSRLLPGLFDRMFVFELTSRNFDAGK